MQFNQQAASIAAGNSSVSRQSIIQKNCFEFWNVLFEIFTPAEQNALHYNVTTLYD